MERYKVEVTNEARTDIRAAARYIAVQLRQPDTAERLLDTLDNEITSLETMPERCGYVHDEYLASLGIRMTMAHNYLIFYVVDRTVGENNVYVYWSIHNDIFWKAKDNARQQNLPSQFPNDFALYIPRYLLHLSLIRVLLHI